MRPMQTLALQVQGMTPSENRSMYKIHTMVPEVMRSVRGMLFALGYTKSVLIERPPLALSCSVNKLSRIPWNLRRFVLAPAVAFPMLRASALSRPVIVLGLLRSALLNTEELPPGRGQAYYHTNWPQVSFTAEPTLLDDDAECPVILCSSMCARDWGPAVEKRLLTAVAMRAVASLVMGDQMAYPHSDDCVLAEDLQPKEALVIRARKRSYVPQICERCCTRSPGRWSNASNTD